MAKAKSYVDTQIAAYQKTVGDAIAGKGLQKAIRQLQEKSKVRDSLKDLPARGAITSKRRIGKRTGSTGGNNFVEISRTFYDTVREIRSSDGLFVLQYQNAHVSTFDTATITWLDYDPDA